MADFVQTMKDWRRMCKDRSCDSCNLKGSCDIDPDSRTDDDIRKIDTKVKIWAAEHPEPVYELWGEWFEKRGDLIRGWHNATNIQWIAKTFGRLMCTPIPADIAQKLGIEPKEG